MSDPQRFRTVPSGRPNNRTDLVKNLALLAALGILDDKISGTRHIRPDGKPGRARATRETRKHRKNVKNARKKNR